MVSEQDENERALRQVAGPFPVAAAVAAKVNDQLPGDEKDDLDSDRWAGMVSLRLAQGEPVPYPRLAPGRDAGFRSIVPVRRLRREPWEGERHLPHCVGRGDVVVPGRT